MFSNRFGIEITYNIIQYMIRLCGVWEMQSTVAALLFVTSAVILASVVVEYTVVVFEQTLDTEDVPQIDRIQAMEEMIMNQTDNLYSELETYNQTQIQQIDQILP